MSLADTRQAVVDAITAAGIRSADYVAETITPPIAVVVPADPYVVYPRAADDVPFAHATVRFDVLLVATPAANRQAAAAADDMIETVAAAIADVVDVVDVSMPTEITLADDKFVGSIIRASSVIRQP